MAISFPLSRPTRAFASATLLAVLAAVSAAPVPAQTGKVAYVDIGRVVEKAKAVSKSVAEIQAAVEKLQKSIEEKRDQVRNMREDLRRTEGIIAAAETAKKKKEIERVTAEIDRLDQDGRRQMQRMQDTVLDPLLKKINFAIQDVAREKKIDIVMRGEAVLYGSTTADISDEVIKKLGTEGTEPTATDQPATGDDGGGAAAAKPARTTGSAAPAETPAAAALEEPAATPASRSARSGAGAGAAPTAPRTRPVDKQPE